MTGNLKLKYAALYFIVANATWHTDGKTERIPEVDFNREKAIYFE